MGRLTGCAICRWVVVRVASSLSPREFAKSERHFKISVRLLSGLGAKPEARSGKLPANQAAVTTGSHHITSTSTLLATILKRLTILLDEI